MKSKAGALVVAVDVAKNQPGVSNKTSGGPSCQLMLSVWVVYGFDKCEVLIINGILGCANHCAAPMPLVHLSRGARIMAYKIKSPLETNQSAARGFMAESMVQARLAVSSSALGQPLFSDHRIEAAQLKSRQLLMADSSRQQRLKTLQAHMAKTTQRKTDEELCQGKFSPAQKTSAQLRDTNNTGLPDNLKAGIEGLSGFSMDHVKVHYNSDKPAQLNAHAYAQGSDIHVAPGQEKHLPHEAWHVVQQAQGRVRPTTQMKSGVPVNDNAGLEHEADVMGQKALANSGDTRAQAKSGRLTQMANVNSAVVAQRRVGFEFETNAHIYRDFNGFKSLVADEAEIFYGAGWKLVSDSGRMEFVSDPFDNVGAFTPIVASIIQFINNAMVGLNTDIRALNAGNWNAATVGAGAVVTSKDASNTTPVTPQDLYGNPQVSVGTRMESLGNFLNFLRKRDVFTTMRQSLKAANRPESAKKVGKLLGKKSIERLQNTVPKAERLVAKWAQGLPRLDQNQLRGIWRLITFYWMDLSRYAGAGDGYIKSKLPVMARTDFHSMYNALTPAAQLAFQNAKDDFLNLNIPFNVNTQPLITGQAFSVADWYESIINPGATQVFVNGHAQVPGHTYNNATRNVDLVSDDSTVAVGTNKSMGQFGMDTHDPNHARAVFELRHVTGGVMIPITDLEQHIIQPVFTLLNNVNA